MSDMAQVVTKVERDRDKTQMIRESHKYREELLQAIQLSDMETVNELAQIFSHFFEKDKVDLMKRVEGDTLRSYKNIMLSHNSMYALMAERGGMDAALSHYMSEKYAIIIESAESRSELSELHLKFLREYANPKHRLSFDESQSLSDKANRIISNNFMNDITIQFIADECFVTKEHLMRTFKEETGYTINDMIQQRRLEEAKKLLIHSNFSITDVAIMVGFNSSQYFSRVFKKAYRLTPSEYRINKNH